ncbi:thiosulfate oxidation carrier protein SoxY [Roseateles sp. BYS87W]|uniref:Thiosulfate oxidation carrier protein SoxY n=1 Tax=Pelomonas baiyunensis TaxID=3299026 RepID=A0ABW7GWT4_9BURK
MISRRTLFMAASALAALPQARATEAAMAAAIRAWAGQTPPPGVLTLDMAELVENGNAVPVRVAAAEPVVGLALFAPLNPEPEVLQVRFGPAVARPEFSTRIRLARSQRIVAVAKAADGRCWQAGLDVIVTLAACVEP